MACTPWPERPSPRTATGGELYVFVSRSGRQIKVLYFDRSGWCVWAKRLEAGSFIADWSKASTHEIDCTQLKLLLEGIEPRRHLKRYRHPSADPQRQQQPPSASHTSHREYGNSDHSRGAPAVGSVA